MCVCSVSSATNLHCEYHLLLVMKLEIMRATPTLTSPEPPGTWLRAPDRGGMLCVCVCVCGFVCYGLKGIADGAPCESGSNVTSVFGSVDSAGRGDG